MRAALRIGAFGTNHGASYQTASRVARIGGDQQHVVVGTKRERDVIAAFGERAPLLDPTAIVFEGATVVGRVILGAESSIWFGAIVRGDVDDVNIGARTNVQDRAVIHVTTKKFSTVIGNEVTIGHAAVLHGCTVHDRVLIGMKAMVMDGAVVESEVILGAGAVVPPGKVLASGHVYVGSPAKAVRAITEEERSYFTYTAANYARLKDSYRDDAVPVSPQMPLT